jgi:hypothetical protein
MNRRSLTFILLAATGGCMAVDRDPVEIPYEAPRHSSAQSWAPPGSSGYGRGWDSKPYPTAATNWGSSSYGSLANTPSGSSTSPSAPVAKKATASTTAVASKTKTSATKSDDKSVVQTSYSDSKASHDSDSGLPSATAGPKSDTTKCSAEAHSKTTEAKSPPINLGVLRLLNSKRVTFRYEVKDPASAGVASLELWGTTDTRSWKKYDNVSRTPTSLVVDVKDEGLYGFSMIARGKGELTKNEPPKPGEPPQVWVAVDLTKPVVQLLGAELSIMSQTPSLVVRWNAKDRNLGPRPITLLYAEHLEGPWSAISANLENSGRYEWIMPPCVPSKLYVRVQATDMMGNVGMAQTTTLHIPGRTATSVSRSEPSLSEPPRLSSVPSHPVETQLKPVAATLPNPAVSILSVDPE